MKDPIKELAQDLTPFKTLDTFKIFILKWFTFSAVLLFMGQTLLPTRADFLLKVSDPIFEISNILWFAVSFLSAAVLYVTSFPEKISLKKYTFPAKFAFGLLFLIIFSQINFNQIGMEVKNEMNLWRGGCGLIITFFSIIHAGFLLYWAKNTAPGNSYLAGFWGALSASALGCLLMQTVCAHDISTHLILWHFVPLALTSFGGGLLAQKFFRW